MWQPSIEIRVLKAQNWKPSWEYLSTFVGTIFAHVKSCLLTSLIESFCVYHIQLRLTVNHTTKTNGKVFRKIESTEKHQFSVQRQWHEVFIIIKMYRHTSFLSKSSDCNIHACSNLCFISEYFSSRHLHIGTISQVLNSKINYFGRLSEPKILKICISCANLTGSHRQLQILLLKTLWNWSKLYKFYSISEIILHV